MVTAPAPPAVRVGPMGQPPADRTLGWAVIDWCMTYLLQPDGPGAGDPWIFTDEQTRFVLYWYAIDDEGRFLYRSGVLRRMKGWGKDPLGVAICCAEFVGPCRFAGWDADGKPIAEAHYSSWVQTVAVAREQTKNAMTLYAPMLSKQAIAEYEISLGKEIIYAHNGRCRVEAVTSSPRAVAGARASFVLMDETHHWVSNNEGLAMAEAVTANTAKSRDGSSRPLHITNAHRLGEGSVAEEAWLAWQQDPAGILYDSLEAPEGVDLNDPEQLRAGLLAARGESVWLDVDRLMGEIQDPRTSDSFARRYYLNQIRAEEHSWLSLDEWAACEVDERTVEAGAKVTLGFDGSRTRDATALVATEIESGYQWVIRVWERDELDPDWEVPVGEVNATVEEAMERYEVWRLNADPYWWGEQLSAWSSRWGDKIVAYNTTRLLPMARAIKAFEQAVRLLELTHDADPTFARHIANAVKRETGFRDEDSEHMYVITKDGKGSPRKIDIAMAAVLSWEARNLAIAGGALAAKPKARVFVFAE